LLAITDFDILAGMCGRCGCLEEGSEVEVRPAMIEGVIEPGLLLLLAEGSSYGYELASELQQRDLVAGPVAPARVYEVLKRLERDGAVEGRQEDSPAGPDRRLFTITPTGFQRLDRWAAALRLSQEHLQTILATYKRQRRGGSRAD
jgi:PadR family transcriptional regulator PadR